MTDLPLRQLIVLSIAELRERPGNAKRHTRKQVELIAREMRAAGGVIDPITITPDRVIVAGHGTKQAAALLGYTDVPVYVVPLSERDAVAYGIAHNRLNLSTGFDAAILADEERTLALEPPYVAPEEQANPTATLGLPTETPPAQASIVSRTFKSNLEFHSQEDYETWQRFLDILQVTYPGCDTVGERLTRYTQDAAYHAQRD